jgi:hypothetical protein
MADWEFPRSPPAYLFTATPKGYDATVRDLLDSVLNIRSRKLVAQPSTKHNITIQETPQVWRNRITGLKSALVPPQSRFQPKGRKFLRVFS